MKATEAKLLDFLKKSPQFLIPIYQRTYSWSEKECRQLWDDILRTGRSESVSAHFIGSIVYVEKGLYQVSSQSPLLVIEKRDMEGGFAQSPLHLNQGLGALTTWNESTIKARAEKLATLAGSVWRSPKLDSAILGAYKPQASTAGYSIDDHSHLVSGSSRELFDAFRKEVLALDPCITEEFLKLYVAFKAETNFVDVVPQAKRLRLSLNVKFHEIDDPRGICKDVSGLGRWGNCDVEIGLGSLEELPYVIGLVRQSFVKQMGNGGDLLW